MLGKSFTQTNRTLKFNPNSLTLKHGKKEIQKVIKNMFLATLSFSLVLLQISTQNDWKYDCSSQACVERVNWLWGGVKKPFYPSTSEY